MPDARLKVIIEAVDQTSKVLDSVGKQMTETGKRLTVGLTLPLVALGGGALKAAIDFESSFAGVRKTVDATEAQFAEMAAAIRQMAKEIPVSTNELNRIAEAAGQLGISTEYVLGFTRVIADLGVTTNLAGDEAASTLARLANITQMSETDFGRLGSTIVALGNSMATTEREIAEMALRLAGTGSQVGMTEAQILGMAAAFSSVGVEAQMGGSAISRALADMANAVASGGDQLQGFAAVAGMTAEEFRVAFEQDAAMALVAFVEGLGRVGDTGGNVFAVLEDLGMGEVRLRDAFLRAAGAGDTLRTAVELSSTAWEENTALTAEAEKRYETTASQLTIMWNNLKDVAITLGDSLIPALKAAIDAAKPFLEFLEDAAKGFADLPKGVQTALIGFGVFLAGIGPVMMGIGALMRTIAALQTAFVTLRAVAATAWIAALGPIALVAGAVAGLGFLFKKVWDDWNKQLEAGGAITRKSVEETEKLLDAADDLAATRLVELGLAKDLTEAYSMLFHNEREAMAVRKEALEEIKAGQVAAKQGTEELTQGERKLRAELEDSQEALRGQREKLDALISGLTGATLATDDAAEALRRYGASLDSLAPAQEALVGPMREGLAAYMSTEAVIARLRKTVDVTTVSFDDWLRELKDSVGPGTPLWELELKLYDAEYAFRNFSEVLQESKEDAYSLADAMGQDVVNALDRMTLAERAALDPLLNLWVSTHDFSTDAIAGFDGVTNAVVKTTRQIVDMDKAVKTLMEGLGRLTMAEAEAVGAGPSGLGMILALMEKGMSAIEAAAEVNRRIWEAVAEKVGDALGLTTDALKEAAAAMAQAAQAMVDASRAMVAAAAAAATRAAHEAAEEAAYQYGGIVTRPTLARVGEAGPEAIIPLRGSGRISPGPITVVVQIDGRVIARAEGDLAESEEQVRSS